MMFTTIKKYNQVVIP